MAYTSIQNFQRSAEEALASLDVAEALRVMRQISTRGDMGRVDDALLSIYLEMSFVRLPQMPAAEAMKLFKEHVLFGLNMQGFDLGARVYDRLSITFEEEDRVTFVREMLRNVEAGTEQLGSELLVLERPVAPTVENWLKEYHVGLSASKNRTGFDEITFLNKNKNVQRLSQQQRALLLRLLGFYDGFSNSLREYDAQPEVYLEDNPELELALINPSPDEWDALSVERMPGSVPVPLREEVSEDEVEDEGDAGTGADFTEGTLPSGLPLQTPMPVMDAEEHDDVLGSTVPNVQGVLVQVPLGASERTGLEVVNAEEETPTPPVVVPMQQPKNTVPLAPSPASFPKQNVRLEDLKAKAQTKQAEVQEEIEHKLADLKRKS